MQAITILSFISCLTLNHAAILCYDKQPLSDCALTVIDVNGPYDIVICRGYRTCAFTEITTSQEIYCGGYFACTWSEEIESTGSSVLCFSIRYFDKYLNEH